jgi:2-polyprenyl-3-methyl-5-hydroxy-6-metoxy-1,4-benzoquinol methylase
VAIWKRAEGSLVTDALPKYHRDRVRWGDGSGTHARLLNLVGFNKRVLEVGCSSGYLSQVMQQRGCEVTGVEVDAHAAERARLFCQRVIVGDIEEMAWESVLGDERFDVITFGDVLEHLRAPEAVLKELGRYLAPDGYIVVSLPNVAHASVRLSLLLGRFEYTSLGVLDESHLRFYTRETARQLLTSSGYRIDDVFAVSEPVPAELVEEVLQQHPQLSRAGLQEVLAEEDAQAFQYVLRAMPLAEDAAAKRVEGTEAVLTLGVILFPRDDDAQILDGLAALAVEGVALRQVIVVAGTEPVAQEGKPGVDWTWQARQPEEREAQALNKAVAAIDADVVLILDEGLAPQAGALSALVERFSADETIGVVGGQVLALDQPVVLQAGAFLAPPVAQVDYQGAGRQADDAALEEALEVDLVLAEALALRRSVWQSLEGFDEGYLGHFFDADFCARAWGAGYRVVIEPEAHFRSFGFREVGVERWVEFHRDRLRFVRQNYGKGSWPAGFFEAESSLLDQVDATPERRAMRLVYLWQLTEVERDPSARESLLALYERARAAGAAERAGDLAPLRAHRFSSSVPVIGGVVARLRAWWGSVAARWYAESLASQQNLLNRALSERMDDLSEEVDELEKLVVWLGRELTDLRREEVDKGSTGE